MSGAREGTKWALHAPGAACRAALGAGCACRLQLRSCPCFWASIMLLLPVLSLRPSAEMPLPAVSSRCYPRRVSPGVCCCRGSAAGCRLPASARQTPSPDASKAVSAKIRAAGCGSPKADGGTRIAVGLRAPHCSSATGRAACSLQGPGSCLSPRPGLCCLSDTRHTGALDEIKPSVPLCSTHWQFGGQERRGRRVKFFFCSFLSLVMSFMGKTIDKYNTRASF